MKQILLSIFGLLSATVLFAQTDLFFSEYIEGTGNDKALEIYNPSGQTIDLTKYYVARYSNGASTYTTGGITKLEGTLEPYKTFILVNGQTTSTESSPACSPILQAKATMLDIPYPAPTYMNGNDAIALLKAEDGNLAKAVPVDLIGQIGLLSQISAENGWAPVNDTIITYAISGVEYKHTIKNFIIKATDDSKKASYGPYWLAWTQDHTLRRKPTVITGVKANPVPFNVSLEWDTISVVAEGVDKITGETYTYRKYKDIWDGLGAHKCVADPNYVSVKEFSLKSEIKAYLSDKNGKMVTIEAGNKSIRQIELYNVGGQLVKSIKTNPSNSITIDAAELESGMYLLKAFLEQGGLGFSKIQIR